MRSPFAAPLFAALALAACADGAAPPASPSLASARQPILGGAVDTSDAHKAVVYIGVLFSACSGTLIAPDLVLTAAHCTCDGSDVPIDDPDYYEVYFGNDVSSFTASADVLEIHRHPDYDPSWGAGIPINDVALLRISATPSDVVPIPYLKASQAAALAAGASVEFVGYGKDDDGLKGTRRQVVDALNAVCDDAAGCTYGFMGTVPAAPYSLAYDLQPGGPCAGDSGGPALLTVGGTQYVAGITSYAGSGCTSFGVSGKVDHYESFIEGVLNPPKALGATCAAGTECASTFCAQGLCCSAACGDACHTCLASAGASADGTCTALSGKSCDDADLCTEQDTCQAGTCQGTAKSCAAGSACVEAGHCDAATGSCVAGAARADGTSCDDGNPCTRGDQCQSGACAPGAPSTCPAPDACHEDAACDASGGTCGEYPLKADGTACDDGDPDTSGDRCLQGACVGVLAGCGGAANGAACDDGNACTTGDTCQDGSCQGGTPVVCAAPEACHQAGLCAWQTGKCVYPSQPNGTACGESGHCSNGTCLAECAGAADGTACSLGTCQGEVCTASADAGADAPQKSEGCGCHNGSGPSSSAALLGTLGFALARRRRAGCAGH